GLTGGDKRRFQPSRERAMSDIYVVGVGMTPFGRMLEVDMKALSRRAVDAALGDAGLQTSDIEAAFFANASQGHMSAST
ncbi:hypothetical protein U0E10_33815, partial [Burkholderia ubonensis]|nr:hypothetical protein [Burkholderia ubonensis]